MKNLHIDTIDAKDFWPDYSKAKHTQWILKDLHLNDEAREVFQEELRDLMLKNKIRVWKMCSLEENWMQHK